MDIIHAWVNTPEPKLIDLLSNNTQGFLRWCLGMLLGNPAACKQEQWWSSKPNYKAEIVANIRRCKDEEAANIAEVTAALLEQLAALKDVENTGAVAGQAAAIDDDEEPPS